MTAQQLSVGDMVRLRLEWKDDPNQIPTGVVRRVEVWGSEGAIHVEGERRAFASYVFELESEREDLQMARCLRLDDQDKAALRKLDDTFTINGETATVEGVMEIKVVRPADDGGARFCLTIRFPGGEELDVRIARSQLLQQLDIEADDS